METKSMTLEPEMAALLNEFLDKIKGKSMTEIMPILTEFKGRLPKDKVFTDEEKNLIVEEALADKSEEEKNRYKTFLKMVKVI